MTLVRADVSEEPIASIIKVKRLSQVGTELGVQLTVTAEVPTSLILFNLMMESMRYSETFVITGATRRYITLDDIRHSNRRENLKYLLW
jgi:hypothetical protein